MFARIAVLCLLVLFVHTLPTLAEETVKLAEDPAVRPATAISLAKQQAISKPRIEIALLLDTSSSMSGLINQARTKLWKIVNEFESARRNGQRADVYVALYEYGNSGLPGESGFIRKIVPLTIDLDKISEELFALTTRGGSEHCGQVIDQAVSELQWSEQQADLRCIFIAGNEAFTQGPVDYKEACHAAANKNVTVSTIHCGDYEQGVQGMWADGAKLADGTYMNIDHNQAEPHIPSPQDDELAALNTQLNDTYCAYGSDSERTKAAERQVAQDLNAASAAPAASASRITLKAGRLYKNAKWDLVDAVRENKVDLTKLKKEQLPEELRTFSTEELSAHINKLSTERKDIQSKIKKLAADRAKFVAAERAKLAEEGGSSLDDAIIKTVREQASRRSFEFAAP